MPTAAQCRRCTSPQDAAVLRSVADGLPIRTAAAAAGIHHVSIHRHRRRCPKFARQLERAQRRGRGSRGKGNAPKQSRQGTNKAAAASAEMQRATPIIAAAVVAGASRTEAAKRAGVNPNTERGWFRSHPTYRAAIEQAQAGATR